MRIKEIGSNYIGEAIDYYAFCIEVEEGVDINIDEIVNQAKHFNLIVIKGREPFTQRDDIVKLFKKLIKENANVKFRVYTRALVRPPHTVFGDVDYWVNIQLKSTNIPYSQRLNSSVLEWYIQANANFIFYANNEDDYDETELIINDFGIPKGKVFLGTNDNQQLFKLKQYCKLHGYSYIINVEQVLHDG